MEGKSVDKDVLMCLETVFRKKWNFCGGGKAQSREQILYIRGMGFAFELIEGKKTAKYLQE